MPVRNSPSTASDAPGHMGTAARMRAALARLRPAFLLRMRRRWRYPLYGAVLAVVLGVGAFQFLPYLPLPASLIAPRVEAALKERLGDDFDVRIGFASLERQEGGTRVRLKRFRIRDAGGQDVLDVPFITIGFAYSADRMFGMGDPRTVEVEAPEVTLRLEPGGGLSLSGGDISVLEIPDINVPAVAARPVAGLVAMLDGLLGSGGALGRLEDVSIRHATVIVEDRRQERRDEMTGIEAHFRRASNGALMARLGTAEKTAPWSATATLSPSGAGRSLDVGLENLDAGRVLESLFAIPPSSTIRGRLSGHLHAGVNSQQQVGAYEARLSVTGAYVNIGGDRPINFDRLDFDARWDFAEPRFSIRRLELHSGVGGGKMRLEAAPSDIDPDVWDYRFEGNGIRLNVDGAGNVPVLLETVRGQGGIRAGHRHIWLDRFALKGPSVSAAGTIGVEWNGKRPVIDATLSGMRVPSAVLTSLWPPAAAPKTRNWIVENIRSGIAEDFAVAFRGPLAIPPPGPDEERPRLDVALDGRFSEGVVALKGQPVVLTGARGTIRTLNGRLDVDIEQGALQAIEGNDVLPVTGAAFVMPDLAPDDKTFDLRVRIEGEAAAAARVLASLDQSDTPSPILSRIEDGTMSGELSVTGVSLHEGGVALGDRGARLATENLAIPALLGPHGVTGGRLAIDMDMQAVTVTGDVLLGGTPLTLSSRTKRLEPGKGLGETVLNLSGDISRIRNVPDVLRGLSGPAAIRVQMARPGQTDGTRVETDLSGTDVTVAGTAIKPAGMQGSASFVVRQGGSGTTLENFRFDAEPVHAQGRVELAADGAFRLARLDSLRLAQGDDARLDVTPIAGGSRVVVRGASLDIRRFIQEIRKGASGGGGGTLDLDVELARAVAHNGVALSDLTFTSRRANGRTQTLELKAGIGDGLLESHTTSEGIYIGTSDAGTLLRAADLYRKVRGGGLELLLAGQEGGQSFLAMREFQVEGEDALKSFAASGGVVRFSKARATYRQDAGRLVIEESAIWGPDVGATMDGVVDFNLNQVNMTGTFVPAYALNNFFAQIPVIGALLGGGQYEGLLGVTFQVTGPVNNPTMRVNPVSAVAPGFLRKLFEFRNQDPSAGQPLRLQPRGTPSQPG